LLLARNCKARSKYASAFAASRSGDISAISPAVRLISASHHLCPGSFHIRYCFPKAAPRIVELVKFGKGSRQES
jgi:hypothetical protein